MTAAARKEPVPEAVLLDTGLLVALYSTGDPLHDAARRWMAAYRGALFTVASVLAETAWQLPAKDRRRVADLAHTGAVHLHTPDATGYSRMAWLLDKYADIDPDWADIELVWLAESTGIDRIATVDRSDFGIYRLNGRRRFNIVWPR
jgi:predicted nucleic acid-binding protein